MMYSSADCASEVVAVPVEGAGEDCVGQEGADCATCGGTRPVPQPKNTVKSARGRWSLMGRGMLAHGVSPATGFHRERRRSPWARPTPVGRAPDGQGGAGGGRHATVSRRADGGESERPVDDRRVLFPRRGSQKG